MEQLISLTKLSLWLDMKGIDFRIDYQGEIGISFGLIATNVLSGGRCTLFSDDALVILMQQDKEIWPKSDDVWKLFRIED
jgi:hypothetical protein